MNLSLSPSHRLVVESALVHRRALVGFSLLNILAGVFEIATFAFIALAVELLSGNGMDVGNKSVPILGGTIESWIGVWPEHYLFIAIVCGIIGCQVIMSAFVAASSIISTSLAIQVQHDTQRHVFRRVLRFSFPCASSYNSGNLTHLVQAPSLYVSTVVDYAGRALVTITLMAFYIAALAWVSLPLFLVACVVFGCIAYLQRPLNRYIRQISKKISEANSLLAKEVVETISALRAIHSLGLWDVQRDRLHNVQQRISEDTHRLILRLSLLRPVSSTLLTTAVGLFLCVGYFFLSPSDGFLSQLVVFIVMLNRLSGKITNLVFFFGQVSQKLGLMSVLDELLDEEGKTYIGDGRETAPMQINCIELKDVHLRYANRETSALKGVSLALERGKVTALVGPSGAGKSSIADLLTGLYQPSSGLILVDGIALRTISPRSWVSRIGVVSQDTILFNDTLRENIRRGRADATDEEVEFAANAAHVQEFAQELPDGYETVVGERGFMLSGGQRQRVALARALIRDAQLLVLDEATSALDTETEQALQMALEELRSDRAILVIAHRLSTIRTADEILVVDDGCIIEQGSHKQLMQSESRYASLWSAQTGATGESETGSGSANFVAADDTSIQRP